MHLRSLAAAFAAAVMTAAASCTHEQPAVSVIFDTDMGNDVDDVVAFDVLSKYIDRGEMKLLAVGLSKDSPQAAEFMDILLTWYGLVDVPVGIIKDGPQCRQDDFCLGVCRMCDGSGNPVYARSFRAGGSVPTAVDLYRKTLASQPDHSVTIISVGFFTNLARLLESGPDGLSPLSGEELIRKKVARLVVMAGLFVPEDKPEYNVRMDIASAQKVYDSWPTEIVTAPGEVGSRVNYPASSIENDFAWAPDHPLVASYRLFKPMPYDRHMWDVMTVFFAAEGFDTHLFDAHPAGRVHVDAKGFTTLEEMPGGNCTVLRLRGEDDGQVDILREKMIDMVTSRPACRRISSLRRAADRDKAPY